MDFELVLKHVDVLEIFLEDSFSVLSVSHIEERLGLSHHPTFRKLKILEGEGVLVKEKGGYSLNVSDPMIIEIMRFLSNARKIRGGRR